MQTELITSKNPSSLKDFFLHKKAHFESKGKHIDWETKKQIWLASIEKLYNNINNWLAPSVEEQLIEVIYEKAMLSEDYIGSYSVKNMIIQTGFERVLLKPKGMIIMGSAGRVDLIGETGTVWLLLLDKKTQYDWQIAVRTERNKSWPLTEESFTDALKWVMQE